MRSGKDFFLQKIPIKDFYIKELKAPKLSCTDSNAFNLDYFGGSPMQTVCNLAANGKVIAQTATMSGSSTAGKAQMTLIVHNNGTAEMKLTDRLDNIPDLLYAIGGVPFMIDGREVSLSKDIKTEGWSGGNFNKTWHTFLTVQDGEIWYIGCNVGSGNDVTATTVIWDRLRQLGCNGTVIKLDGGGSFFLRVNGKTISATAENRTINYIGGWKGDTVYPEYQYPFREPFVFGTRFGVTSEEAGAQWAAGYHTGLDLKSVNYGGSGNIYPIAEGKVIFKQALKTGYGNSLRIQHPDGYISLYAHFAKMNVNAGDYVYADTLLGTEGQTGNASGKHLHLEIHKGEYAYAKGIEPAAFLAEKVNGAKAAAAPAVVQTPILLCGERKTVGAVNIDNQNYIKLRDLACDEIKIDYDAAAKLPTVEVSNK